MAPARSVPAKLRETIFLPVTGNPVGFHHLLLAELALRHDPQLRRVVFLLSNGQHPDPFKQSQILPKESRLMLLRDLLADLYDPVRNRLLQLSKTEPLLLCQATIEISTREFSEDRPFRLVEHVQEWADPIPDLVEPQPVQVLIGSDLAERMLQPQIFATEDLQTLSQLAELWVVPRPDSLATALEELPQRRQLKLRHRLLQEDRLPQAFRPYLQLSSTLIRQAFGARAQLGAYLSITPTERILENGWYQTTDRTISCNECEEAWFQAEKGLQELARQALESWASLTTRPTLAVVETSAGGRIAGALIGLPGASGWLLEAQVVYGRSAKERLLQRPLLEHESSVSAELAVELAWSLLNQSGADWALAETGMAGPPDGSSRSSKQGLCHLAIAHRNMDSEGPAILTQSFVVQANPFLTKQFHQLHFAQAALARLHSLCTSSSSDESL